MGKQVTRILKKLGFDTSAQPVAPVYYRSKLKTPAERAKEEKEKQEREKRHQAWLKSEQERIERENEERRKREEEYNIPLPEFAPKIQRETRVRLLTYVAKVFNDAARIVLERELQAEMRAAARHDIRRYDLWLDEGGLKEANEFVNFEDRPVQEFSVAIRIAELKPLPDSSQVDTSGFLYIRHESHDDQKLLYLAQHAGVGRRVSFRLENNLFKNLPILEPILGKGFEVRFWTDDSFDELKKSGYTAEPGEQKVVHLEIF